MGKDIHVRIIKKDRNTNTWKQIKLYHKEKGKFKLVNVYPFRSYELFDILSGNDEKYNAYSICLNDLPNNLKQEVERCKNTIGYYNFFEINLADLKLYLQRVPKVKDYDSEKENAWKNNPVKYFVERIEQYIDFVDSSWDLYPYSDVKILYWFDC